ncbi:MAG TPA: hypothetical protein DCM08_06115 [Microscillaceae bacterium]|jgi:HAD superfamily hydrolase (TIGR01509 family)|nr:hypothetical protein [Microscillaceae bacterium]
MYQLFIFDVDGVLLDSEPLYRAMHRQWFAELGFTLPETQHLSMIGMAANKFWQYLKDNYHLSGEIADYIAEEKARKFQTLQTTPLMPSVGIEPMLQTLKRQGFPTGIASSGLLKNIQLILSRLGFEAFFDHIVSGEQVSRGKPEPDIFLQVAAHFNISPEACVVIEDSTNGVTGAKAAGMFCVGYQNPTSGQQDLSKADLIVDRLDDPRLQPLWTKS